MSQEAQGQEVESLYVSFGGDGSGFEGMMDSAVTTTTESTSEITEMMGKASKQIAKEWQIQAKTFGMTAREVELYRLKLEGATDDQLELARAADKTLSQLEREQQEFQQWASLRDEVETFTKSIEAQGATFGMTARQADIYRLRVAGASDADLDAARAADRLITRKEKLKSLFEQGKQTTQQYRSALEVFTQRQKELNQMLAVGAINAGTYAAAMKDARDKLGTGWDRIAQAMNPVNTAIMTIGRNVQNLGRSFTMYVSAPIAAVGALGVREFGSFNNAMTEGYAIMGKLDDVLKNKLAKSIRDVSAGQGSKFTPDKLAEGLKGLAASGLSAEQSLQSLGVVERFATAGAFGLERATQLLLDSQSALGMIEKDAIKNKENLLKVSDALVKAGDQSTAAPEQFAEALANGAADAKNFGMELSEIMAVLDAYASKGNKGAAAGSDLARATRLLSQAVRNNGEVFKSLGIDVIDEATGEYKSFIDIIGEMEKSFVGLTGPQRAAMLELMGFEALAQSAILPLIGMSDQMKIWKMEQQNATDYTKNVAGVQMESFNNRMLALWGQIKEVGIGIGEMLVPAIKLMTDALSYGLTAWRNMGPMLQGSAVAIGAITAGMGPLIVMIGGGVVAAGMFSSALTTLGLSAAAATVKMKLLALASPVGQILAVATASYALGRAFDLNYGYTAKWNRELASAIKLSGELDGKMKSLQDKRLDSTLGQAKAIEDPTAKRAMLNKELELAQKNVQGLSAQVGGAFKRVDELTTTWAQMVDPTILNTAKEELKETEQNLENARARADKLKEALKEMGDAGMPGTTNAITPLMIDINALEQELKKSIETFGDTSNAVKIYELQLAGATDEQLASVRALEAQHKAMTDAKKAQTELEKYESDMKSLEAEVATFGQGARAAQLYKMALEGATAEQMDYAYALDASLTVMEKEKKHREAMRKYEDDVKNMQAEIATFGQGARAAEIYKMQLDGASEAEIRHAMSLNKVLTGLEKDKKLREKATEVTKKHAPVMERFTMEQGELKTMLDKGMISLTTYNKALEDIWKDMAKEYKVEFKVGGIDSVAAGSAEAIARVQAYLALRDNMNNPTVKIQNRNASAPAPTKIVPSGSPRERAAAAGKARRAARQGIAASRRAKKSPELPAPMSKPRRRAVLATPISVGTDRRKRRQSPSALAPVPQLADSSGVAGASEVKPVGASPDSDLSRLLDVLTKIETNTRPGAAGMPIILRPSTITKGA